MLTIIIILTIGEYICIIFFFFNDTATTEIYTLSLHDALPIYLAEDVGVHGEHRAEKHGGPGQLRDRKSTRLNSSHLVISYAVFCLKKKKKNTKVAKNLRSASKSISAPIKPSCINVHHICSVSY